MYAVFKIFVATFVACFGSCFQVRDLKFYPSNVARCLLPKTNMPISVFSYSAVETRKNLDVPGTADSAAAAVCTYTRNTKKCITETASIVCAKNETHVILNIFLQL